METLNIVNLIERNPLTKISKDYQNKLVNKLQEHFTNDQQQLFIASFYCYLNYNPVQDFVINLDDVWKWVGFSRKDHAKRLFEKHFIKDIDYKIISPQPRINIQAGRPQENITMTINTFKKFCLKSNTKKADEIHNYYIKLEEILHEIATEEAVELRQQLDKTNNKLIDTSEKLFKLEENHKRILYKRRRYTLKKGACFYILKNPSSAQESYKFGISKNLNSRQSSYATYFEPEFLYITFTNLNHIIESLVKNKFCENMIKRDGEWLLNVNIETIIKFVQQLCELSNINYTEYYRIEDIYVNEEDTDDTKEDTDDTESIYTKAESDILEIQTKKCNKCLTEHLIENFNKDKTKKDGFNTICKDCCKISKLAYKKQKQEIQKTITEKRCAACLSIKPISEFTQHLYTKDGYTLNCKPCANEILKTKRQIVKDAGVRYKCGKCSADYARIDTLNKHIKNCNGKEE
jgi:phage anti-repressor protein